jgi:hypothetical protein
MLDHALGTLTVECLPAKIPGSIEVDISYLAELDQAIRVKDITLDKDITVLNNPDLVVAKISVRPVEKVEEKVVEEVVEAEAKAEVAEEATEAPKEAAPGGKKSKET